MSHKCVRCGNIYMDDDASILRGCTGCGGIFFLYVRSPEEIKQVETVEQELQKKDTTLEQELTKQIEKRKTEEVEIKEEKIEEVKRRPRKRVEVEEIKIRKTKFGIETIRVPREGVYEINIDALMKKRPVIVLERGHIYIIRLPEMFERVRKK